MSVWYVVGGLAAHSTPASGSTKRRHGGCRLYERLGPQVHVCRDGTVWHRRVDGPEYMGNLNDVGPPPVVPAAG